MEVFITALERLGSLAIVAYIIWWDRTKLSTLLASLDRNMSENTAALREVRAVVVDLREEKEVLKIETRNAVADKRDVEAGVRDEKANLREVRADDLERERDAKANQ